MKVLTKSMAEKMLLTKDYPLKLLQNQSHGGVV